MADMTLEEALAAATVDEELVTPVNEVLMINPETRTIHVPDSEKLFGVRQDMSVERKYFKCPRIVGDNIDLFEHYVFVNYIPSDQNGKYESEKDVQGYWCRDLAVEGDFITFSWELTENVLRKAGYIAFAVYAKVSDENGNLKTKWHTTITIGNVLDTLPDGEEWITIYPDIVTQLLERMDAVEKIANPESMQEYVDDYFNRNPMMIDRELKDSTKAAPADIVGKLSEDIATKASTIKETASGETIVVTDSDEAKPLGLAIDGKSEQNQYSGKNLLPYPYPKTTDSSNGIVFTILENGAIKYKGTSTGYATFIFSNDWKPNNGTYKKAVGEKCNFIISRYLRSSNTYQSVVADNKTAEFSTTDWDFETYKYFVLLQVTPSHGAVDNVFYPMICPSTETDMKIYEPYCGGIPSPNTEYEQEIRNIGVYDEASGKYAVEVKCTGKNRFNCEKWKSAIDKHASGPVVRGTAVFENNGITITANEANAYSGFEGASSYAYKIPVNIGDSIILSWEENSGKDGMVWIFANGDSAIGVNVNTKNTKEITYTVPEDTTFITVRFGVVNSGDTISYKNIMLRPVGTDDTYEPYKETTATVYLDEPLRKGDKAYWNGEKLRIDRNFIRARMTSDLSWAFSSSTNRFYASDNRFKKGVVGAVKPNALCNMFVVANQNNINTDLIFSSVNEEMTGHAFRHLALNGDINAWKQFLDENEVYVCGEANEPTTEEIDIDLGELTMFYPTTIISNDCNANMEVEYIADTKAYIDKKFAELATAMV